MDFVFRSTQNLHELKTGKFPQNQHPRVVLMDSGLLVESSTPDTFFTNPKEERTRKFLSQIL
jgi:general L-amino acid transport system ATP-binding protein